MEQIKKYQVQLDRELSKYPQIVKISEQCNVPKTYLVEGVAGFVILLLFFNVWGQLFSNLVAWGYPAYASFKAIETAKKDDDTQWLTYWTVLGFIHTLEFFSDNILFWLPSYFFLKTLFFLWLFMPQTKGAQKLYTGFLRPTLLTYEKDVDSQLNRVKTKYM